MAKNRRYSQYNSSRGRSKKRENPLLIGSVLVVSVLLAALCGRTLDSRYARISTAGRAEAVADLSSDGDRAGLRMESPAEQEASASQKVAPVAGDADGFAAAIREIERVSGVAGEPPLHPDRWVTETPLLLGNVDVSGMLAQEFALKRSLQNGYSPRSVSVRGVFSRPGAYLDLLFKDEKGAAQVIRFDGSSISVVYRSPSGIEVERGRAPFSVSRELGKSGGECEKLTLSIATEPSQPSQIVCAAQAMMVPTGGAPSDTGRVVMSLPILPVKSRFISVSTNLVKSELKELTVVGDIRGSIVEDSV